MEDDLNSSCSRRITTTMTATLSTRRPNLPPALAAFKQQGRDELAQFIRESKALLGDKLVILGHHYQADDVIQFADFTGDSFKLAQEAARVKGCQ